MARTTPSSWRSARRSFITATLGGSFLALGLAGGGCEPAPLVCPPGQSCAAIGGGSSTGGSASGGTTVGTGTGGAGTGGSASGGTGSGGVPVGTGGGGSGGAPIGAGGGSG